MPATVKVYEPAETKGTNNCTEDGPFMNPDGATTGLHEYVAFPVQLVILTIALTGAPLHIFIGFGFTVIKGGPKAVKDAVPIHPSASVMVTL